MIHSRWFRLVVIVVLMVAGGLFLWQYNQVDKPQLVNSDGRVFEKARVVDIVRDNLQEDGSRVGDQIVTLRMEDGPDAGQTVQANCPNGLPARDGGHRHFGQRRRHGCPLPLFPHGPARYGSRRSGLERSDT